jgi:GTP-binding protein HflX
MDSFFTAGRGIGTKGPGEKQLEVDRRLVKKKISELTEKLKKIEQNRINQRKSRGQVFKVSLVGYTNVGKSSILNALCGSEVLVEEAFCHSGYFQPQGVYTRCRQYRHI